MATMPTVFVSHGAPSLAVEPGLAHSFLRTLPARWPRPSAIVVASAHWLSAAPLVEGGARPETIHDFSGFPDELYDIEYRARGHPALAARVCALLGRSGIAAHAAERGLDHGAWVPLLLMYPKADIPVIQISLQPVLGPAHHLALGRALAPLTAEGVLVMGSGSATHNLGELRVPGSPPAAWAVAFDNWLCAAAEAGDAEALVDYRELAPQASRNHPSEEHYLPLLVALGAAGEGAKGTVLHRSMTYGSLSMTDIAFSGPKA
jgi:4,5-DOPA dioxygenase extradiol